jgi:ABC-type sulfate transport system permease component
MKENAVSKTVFYSVAIILSIVFLVYLLFWKQIKEYTITEFWKSMTDKQYLNSLLLDVTKDPNSFFGSKK